MERSPANLPESYRDTQKRALLFGQGIVFLMMVCLTIAFAQFAERVIPDWHGGFLIFAGCIVSIEAMATRKQTEELEIGQQFLFHLSEWIAIAVLLKILIYLFHGASQFITDLSQWQSDFLRYFFTGEYLLALLILLAIWFFSRSFAAELSALYRSQGDSGWEDLGKLQNILHEIRDRCASRIFIVGAVVTVLAVLSRLSTPYLPIPPNQANLAYAAPVIVVLVDMALSLILLSQTQFALMQTRWFWQSLTVSPRVRQNWLKYGVLFFLILAAIVSILPTQYSIGFFETLGYGIQLLFRALTFLIFLIMLPFAWIISLFSSASPNPSQPPPLPTQAPVLPNTPGTPIAWLEFLRSLAFWIIFLAIIFCALRFYLMQNAALWSTISSFRLFRWAAGVWSAFWGWLKGANQQVAKAVRVGVKRLTHLRPAIPKPDLPHLIHLSRLSPRAKIIYYYLTLLDLGSQQGLARKPAQTPYQYEKRLGEAVPDVQEDVRDLTETFIEARYSQHPVSEPHSRHAGSLFDRIKAALVNRGQPK